ncbi:MAG TPA: polysaccharide deacetylase family protein [Xanthobacteraceae bacterium]|nr:polysaccharide deacetylase family protein [Xanthobacteraceae bacterium]
MQLAVQNNTPLPAESAPVPVQADAPAHPQDTTPAASAKPDAAAAPAPDSKQQDSGKDGKPDSAAPVQAQSPAPVQATAQNNCPGNPNALGTSRVLAIDPADFKRLGHMQYPDSLPLQDKEVVITFDDGPLPPYSNQILDILAAECVKVTYFLVGEMARAYPAVVRREYEAGHTLGTHSEHHPLHFGELPLDRMRSEIDVGISDVAAALGDTKYLAPFFRIPGLDRSNTLEDELAARHLIVFSSDTVADDWRHVTPEQIKSLALSRLMKLGKGILLLHDIHPKTVAALPGILKGLKDNGFRIVQVVPSASYQIAMANKPKTPILASATPDELKIGGGIDNAGAQPAWPQPAALSDSLKPGDVALPAPDASSFQPDSGMPDDSASVQWPEQPKATASSDEDAHGDKSSEHERHRKHDADSDEHGRHHRRHQRARSSEGHRADLVSNIKSLAGMFTPAH